VDIAFKNNPDVKQAELSAESAKINYEQARDNRLPTLNASVNHTLYNGRSINPYTNAYIDEQNTAGTYQLTTGVTLWNGSSIQRYMKQYALSYEAGKMDTQNEKDKLMINVILNYLSVLSTREQLNIARKQVEGTKSKVDLLEIKNNDGAISPSDLYDMKGQLATDELTVVTTKNDLENAKLALAQLMNIPYSSGMDLVPIAEGSLPLSYDATVDQVYDNATHRLALVKSVDLKVAGAAKNIQAVKGQMMPTLSFSAGIYSNYSSTANTQQLVSTTDIPTSGYVLINNVKTSVFSPQPVYNSLPITYGSQLSNNLNSSVSIGLQIPILNNGQLKNKLRQAKVAEQQATVQAQTTRIQLKQAIEQDFVNLQAAYETYKTLLDQVTDFAQSFHAADVRFAAGAISTVDYVIAKNNLDKVQLNLVAAKYNYILRTKILDFYQDRPLW
jgi:outer membrane protein